MEPTIIRQLNSGSADFPARLASLRDRWEALEVDIEDVVRKIIRRVRQDGDSALLELTAHYDRVRYDRPANLEIPPGELDQALEHLEPGLRQSLEQAADRIQAFHRRQIEQSWSYVEEDGTRLGQQVRPLDRVGLYVPGGQAAYPSSVLMNALPARVAGVGEIVMVVPAPDGRIIPAVLAAARIAGVDRVFRVGGAQAVAALAYGTGTVPRVDKIVGPGNIYVAEAKKQVFGQVGIDMIAGPSEVVVICDSGANPEWLAMDLMAQAEHDELAQAILICPEPALIKRVLDVLRRQLPQMERQAVIESSLGQHGAIILVDSLTQAVEVSNRIAPEHLQLMVRDPEQYLPLVRHAGAIFCGYLSAESLGDYCAGPNHVLPTAGTARFSSPLGVYDFQKRSSLIYCSPEGAASLSAVASTIARAEGLSAHARSAEMRGHS